MKRLRRIAASAALAGGLALAALAPTGAQAQGPAACVVLCPPATTTTTTAPPPTTTTTAGPTVGPLSVADLSATSARPTASVTTGAAGVTYGFSLGTLASQLLSLGASSTPQQASFDFTGLVPGVRYIATLGVNPPSGGGITRMATFTTPLLPAPRLTIAPQRTEIALGSGFVAAVRVGGYDPVDSGDGLTFQATGPDGHLTTVRTLNANSSPPTLFESGTISLAYTPTANTEVRALLTGMNSNYDHAIRRPSASRAVHVYVFPRASSSLTRPNPYKATLVQSIAYATHTLTRHWKSEPVYFYRAASKKGPYRLIGHAPLRFLHGSRARVGASLRFNDTSAVFTLTCVRHAVVPDMGPRFTDADCGRATIRG